MEYYFIHLWFYLKSSVPASCRFFKTNILENRYVFNFFPTSAHFDFTSILLRISQSLKIDFFIFIRKLDWQ